MMLENSLKENATKENFLQENFMTKFISLVKICKQISQFLNDNNRLFSTVERDGQTCAGLAESGGAVAAHTAALVAARLIDAQLVVLTLVTPLLTLVHICHMTQ